ncbi:hypothetical protein [Litchfieldella rifensis]|uniref:Apea-like HEPN domain-containing protein n=1 Tax=Litchfieldella rifensis TaxID=762643 RepID=A0ABV7LLP0_9GAMM
MKKKLSIDEILNQTFFGLDTLTMLDDVEHFIKFAESNIAWQKHSQYCRTERECDKEEFDDPSMEAQYRDQMLEDVVYRFDVGLTQRVRYAGLAALITTIEWCLLSLKKRATFPFPKKRDSTNETIHVLSVFNEKATLGLEAKIEHLEAVIQVRNCLVHAAGLLESFRYEQQLRARLLTLSGINASNTNFLGEIIEIKPGFLEGVVEDVRTWLPSIEQTASQQGLLRK